MTTQGDFRCISCDTDDFLAGTIYHGVPLKVMGPEPEMPDTTVLRSEKFKDHHLDTRLMWMWIGFQRKNEKAVFELAAEQLGSAAPK